MVPTREGWPLDEIETRNNSERETNAPETNAPSHATENIAVGKYSEIYTKPMWGGGQQVQVERCRELHCGCR